MDSLHANLGDLGFFQDETGQSLCKQCTGGSVSLSDFTGCVCDGGYGFDGGECVECGEGRFSNDNSLCEDCAYGYNEGLSGQTECIFCGAGQYEKVIGNQECFECPVGYSNYGSASCTACESGKYQSETGQKSCTDCAIGQFQDEEGKINCKDCVPGKHGTTTGQSTCSDCYSGTYQDLYGKLSCKDCEAGTYQDEEGKTSCEYCTPGKHGIDTGQSTCFDCDSDTYQDEWGQTDCKHCLVGAPAGSVLCGSGTCLAGQYGLPGTAAFEKNLGTHTDDNIKFSPNEAFVFTGKRKLINVRGISGNNLIKTLSVDGDMSSATESSATNGDTYWVYWIEGDPTYSNGRGLVTVKVV